MPIALILAACVTGDLARGRPVAGAHATGELQAITSDAPLEDGTQWNAPGTVQLGPEGSLTIDLGAAQEIRALEVQADGDDSYYVEGAGEGTGFSPLWIAVPTRLAGLITRHVVLPAPATVRKLRISPRGGDGYYSVAHVRAYCVAPAWPIAAAPDAQTGVWNAIDEDNVLTLKGVIAAVGALVLLIGLRFKGANRLLGILGVLSFCAWFNFAHFHFNNFLHVWDVYHYYIGAKYFPELGYTRLYQCTTEAEAELYGEDAVSTRLVRNLTTNVLEPPVLDGSCRARFSAERWTSFQEDIRFFRGQLTGARWAEVLQDHGYNGTPVWCVLGRLFASTGRASQLQVFYLALLDPLLLIAMWLLVTWAFGFETACAGLLFWGCNYASRYYWNGGAYLRMDWLFAAIAGICCVKKEKHGAGGFLLAYSALLRIFPAFIFVGLFCKAVHSAFRRRNFRPIPAHGRFAVGALAALAVFIPASLSLAGGPAAWHGFVENSKKHLQTPLTNNMGLKTVLSWEGKTRVARARDFTEADSFARWKEARRRVFGERRLIWFALLAAFVALLYLACRDQPDWIALVLSVGLIPFASELTCYYMSILLAYALLLRRWPILAVALAGIAAASNWLPFFAPWDDARYFDLSCWLLLFIVAATVTAFAPSRRAAPAARA